jgi:U3 small nucleolar RNA-associated protein 25
VRCDGGREEGSVGQVVRQLPQLFARLSPSVSPSQLPDHRLKYFSSQVLPSYRGDLMKGTVIFIPSYFDFVRVRNLMKKEELSLAALSEYTTTSGVTRARTQFYQGLTHFLLYTERAHFFHRLSWPTAHSRNHKRKIIISLMHNVFLKFYIDF